MFLSKENGDGKKIKLFLWLKNSTRADVINIAWPILLELLMGSLFGMVDMMMLGRMGNSSLAAASVSAVGMTNQPLFIGLSCTGFKCWWNSNDCKILRI